MKTSSYQSSNYDYTGRSVIIQQQQQPREAFQESHQFAGPTRAQSLRDGYLAESQVAQQYVVDDQQADDVAIVSTSALRESVGRRNVGEGGPGVPAAAAVEVVVVDEGQALSRYPTIQFAGPSKATVVLCPEDVAEVLRTTTSLASSGQEEKVRASGAAVKFAQQQVVVKNTLSAKRKRETGECLMVKRILTLIIDLQESG